MALDLTKIGNTISFGSPLEVATVSKPLTVPKALTTQNTAPTTQISVTPKPDNTNYAGMLASAQQQALSLQQQIQGMNQPTTPTANPEQSNQTGGTDIKSYIDSIMGVQQPSAVQSYQTGYDASGLAQKEADVAAKAAVTTEAQGRLNNISAQLTALNAEATAVPIQVQKEFAGTGATRGGVAPIETARLRDIALKALPLQSEAAVVQAQVANAAGQQALAQDLYKQAEDKFNQFFQLQMEDANRKYELKTNLVNRVYQFADAKEQRQLALIKDQADKDYQTQRDTIAYQRDIQKIKLQDSLKNSGGGGLLSITEAKELGVPYGTTKVQAQGLGITPGVDEAKEKAIIKVQSTPEYKTVSTVLPAIQSLKAYKDAIKTYGTTERLNNTGQGTLAGSYGNAIATWKTLAGLGALSGADFALAENAVPATGFFQTKGNMIGKLDASLKAATDQAEAQTKRIVQTNPLAAPTVNAQLIDVLKTAYPEKNYVLSPDGMEVIEITK